MEKEKFLQYLQGAVKHGASDVHFKAGSPPMYRINKSIRGLKDNRLTPEDTRDIAKLVLGENPNVTDLDAVQDYDTSFALPGQCRFRVNIFRQRGSFALVLRIIPEQIPSFDDLLLPPQIVELAEFSRGLVLVTGSAGQGKSSTLAAMINYINMTRACHIVTIEDPVEFLHRDRKASISQREVGTDTAGFNNALRAALRQDPDVVLVGEMRDLETIDIALKASETGHMVYSTVHTPDAAKTIGRLIAVFPPEEQEMVRIRLAENLRATVSQRLVPRADGQGMVVAYEIMKVTGMAEDTIKNPEGTAMLKDVIEKSRQQYGMISFDQCLTDLFKGELITFEMAKRYATSPGDFERAMHFD